MQQQWRRRLVGGGKILYSFGLSGILLYCAVVNFGLNIELWQAIRRVPGDPSFGVIVGGSLALVLLIIGITILLEN